MTTFKLRGGYHYRSRLHFALRVVHEAVEKPHAESLIAQALGLPDAEPLPLDDNGEFSTKERTMPRVNHVAHAQKDHPEIGVKKGEPYYWWKFKNRVGNGTVVKSKTPPKSSQLTRSEFASTWRGIEERISDLPLDEGLHDALQEIAGDLRALADEQDEKFNNMPEGLQQGSTGELLEQRRDAANEWADAIEALHRVEREDDDPDTPTARADDRYDEALENLKQEALDANPGEP